MKESLVDVAVLLVFFSRPDTFKKVFDVVKKARPSKLFLYQDGPREGRKDDVDGIRKCREIAENIDWQCEVHTFYQEKNQGCDPSGYIAQTWTFSQVDKCIVIEDDDVPSVSFFRFCKEMLDKYENDKRIMLITGLNVDEITTYCPYDYFFSSTTFTCGCWASWKRVVEKWDKEYSHLSDPYYSKLMEQYIENRKFSKGFLPSSRAHKDSGKAHFETIMIGNQYLENGLTIIPKKNMVLNIGLTENATHTSASLEYLPKGYRRIFQMKTYDVGKKIIEPLHVTEDFAYKERAYKAYGWRHTGIKIYRMIETSIYMIAHGKFKALIKTWKEKIFKFRSKNIS